jgi:hypothetical protein
VFYVHGLVVQPDGSPEAVDKPKFVTSRENEPSLIGWLVQASAA